jgi:hypothetical protein
MAKQRPSLGVAASPVSTFVAPVDPRKTVEPIDEGAIRNAYEFADAFSNLSETAAKFATTIKTQQNEQDFLAGQDLVNQNRKTYANLVGSGQIKPSENPWLAVGAQQASGVLEAAKARNDFKTAYDNAVLNNPELLKDNQFFDALAASFAEQKNAEFGTSQYLSRSFYKEFNPFLIEQSAKHADAVGKYNQKKIIDSLRLKVDEAVTAFGRVPDFGLREDNTPKDVGYYGIQYGFSKTGRDAVVTERSIGVEFDGVETQIPMLVPGLSLEAREAIIYAGPEATPDEILDQLDPRDRELIYDHAIQRMKEGKSPFYSTLKDKIVPDLQGYLDELGQSLGLPRVANLATASHLIEAMKGSTLTYEAEAILSELKAGTGKLIDVSEVKSMLLEAREDIQKNRFELGKSNETQIVAVWADEAYKKAFDEASKGVADASYGEYVDQWREMASQFKYLGIEDRAKMWDQFNERWNNATREGRESAERADKEIITNFVFQSNAAIGYSGIIPANEWDGQAILDWGSARNRMDSLIASRGVTEESKKSDIRGVVSLQIDNWLTNAQNEAMRKLGLSDLTPSSQDSADVRQMKAMVRTSLKLNELQASLHFDLEDRLESLRRISLDGITFDVEKGPKQELVDLVLLYQNASGGRAPIDLFYKTKGPRGERTLLFLQTASLKSQYMSIPDAIRDAAQAINMDATADVLELTNIKENGSDMEALRLKADEALEMVGMKGWRGWADWIPFVNPDLNLNPDARKTVTSMFIRKFAEEMASNGGAANASSKAAMDFVSSEAMNINGGVLPRSAFAARNVTESYIAAFIALEVGEKAFEEGATLVWVDNAPNGQPVFALRDRDGRALKDGYYLVDDIASDEKPKGPDGNIIREAKSPRERVASYLAEIERKKKKKSEEMRKIMQEPDRQFRMDTKF